MSSGELEAIGITPVLDENELHACTKMYSGSYRSFIDPSPFELVLPVIDGEPRLDLISEPGAMDPDNRSGRDALIVRLLFPGRQYKGAGCFKYTGNYVRREDFMEYHEIIPSDEQQSCWFHVLDTRFIDRVGILLPVTFQFGQDPMGGQSTLERIVFDRQQRVLDKAFRIAFSNGGTEMDARKIFKILAGILLRITPIADKCAVPELSSTDICVAEYAVQNDTRRLSYFSNQQYERFHRKKDYERFVLEKYGDRVRIDPQAANSGHTGEHSARFLLCREEHLKDFFSNLSLMVRAVLEAGLTNPRDQYLGANIDVEGGIADLKDLADIEDPHQAIGLLQALITELSEFGEVAGFEKRSIFKTSWFREFLKFVFESRDAKILSFIEAPYFMEGGASSDKFRIIKLACLMTDAWAESQGAPPKGGYYRDDRELMESCRSVKSPLDFNDPEAVDRFRSIIDGRRQWVPTVAESS